MKITFEPELQGKKGYAMLITLMFLGITVFALIDMWRWTENNAELNKRNNTFNQSADAAEAATEKVFTPMDRDFLYGNLNTASYYSTNIPNTSGPYWSGPVQYTFSDGNGNNNQIYVGMAQKAILEPLNAQYAGLNGYSIDCTNIAVATPVGLLYNVPATVQQTFQAAIIPVFQFAIFYNLNLEIDPGGAMTIAGPVFCNQNIWEGSPNTTYSLTVSAVGTNFFKSGNDPFCSGKSDSGNPTFLLPSEPTDHNNALVLPIGNSTDNNPTNVEAILNLPPANLSVPADIGYLDTNQIYLYNASDIIISNAATGKANSSPTGTCSITIFYDDKYDTPPMRQLTNDYYTLKTGGSTNYVNYNVSSQSTAKKDSYTNVLYAGWSFATNVSFFDYREGSTVQAVQIDISKFNIWVTNQVATNGGGQYNILCGGTDGSTGDKYHPIGSIYVINKVPPTSSQLPAVRLINGQVLPSSYGLTVSTPQPAYVYGNYNVRTNLTKGGTDIGLNVTTNSWPAAIMADAVTVLSTNWNDATESSTEGNRKPVATTVNAAMLEGIVQSSGSSYSGGVENFLRLLEAWSPSIPLTYNGSIVVMFPSVYATNPWNGNYYGVPKRQWAFDLNFTNAAGLPPLSPSSRALVRGNWSAY